MDKGLFHPRCRHGLGTYYPEIDEIDREYDGYVERDVTDYGEHSKAHIENMIQRYKRLSLGSIDPDNVAKYEAKLREWEEIKQNRSVDNIGKSDIIKSSKVEGKNIVLQADNLRVHEWYVRNVSDIPNRIDKNKSFEEQVKQAFELRNKYKREARVMMSDKKTADRLERLKPVPGFEQLVKDKMQRKNMTREEALEDILKTASKTNEDVNKEFGL